MHAFLCMCSLRMFIFFLLWFLIFLLCRVSVHCISLNLRWIKLHLFKWDHQCTLVGFILLSTAKSRLYADDVLVKKGISPSNIFFRGVWIFSTLNAPCYSIRWAVNFSRLEVCNLFFQILENQSWPCCKALTFFVSQFFVARFFFVGWALCARWVTRSARWCYLPK